jgi:hypothetical protein
MWSNINPWRQVACLLRYPKGSVECQKTDDLVTTSNHSQQSKLDLLLWECDWAAALLPEFISDRYRSVQFLPWGQLNLLLESTSRIAPDYPLANGCQYIPIMPRPDLILCLAKGSNEFRVTAREQLKNTAKFLHPEPERMQAVLIQPRATAQLSGMSLRDGYYIHV